MLASVQVMCVTVCWCGYSWREERTCPCGSERDCPACSSTPRPEGLDKVDVDMHLQLLDTIQGKLFLMKMELCGLNFTARLEECKKDFMEWMADVTPPPTPGYLPVSPAYQASEPYESPPCEPWLRSPSRSPRGYKLSGIQDRVAELLTDVENALGIVRLDGVDFAGEREKRREKRWAMSQFYLSHNIF